MVWSLKYARQKTIRRKTLYLIEDGKHYLVELQHDEYGNTIEQHENVMKDDRDSDTITKSRNKNTQQHHRWKAKDNIKTCRRGKP